ncbi:MAG TPA: VWA domain-containing protein [Steroidobacteraceae bacterium]|jgi:magnesium chelatase subunit D
MRLQYPFSDVIGQEDLKLALLLVAVDPGIGGVLIRGERGTAKSTVARGLATLLPPKDNGQPAPFVELPMGATEDRVVGSLDLTKALREGQTQLRPGVLSRADGGVLYVDEVNLLPDHLVDLLLDAAASGWVTIERDGISASESARFVLVGTMNPEEGNLRPQFLDRFGLCVDVQGLATTALRMAAVGSRLAFDENPAGIVAAAQPEQERLQQSIVRARARLPGLSVSSEHLSLVAAIANEQRLDGIRGDIAIIKAARALAAWDEANEITSDHIRRASQFALPHRAKRRRNPGATRNATNLNSPDLPSELPDSAQRHTDSATDSPLQPAPTAQNSGSLELLTDIIDLHSTGRRKSDAVASGHAMHTTAFDHSAALAINETLISAATRGVRVGAQGIALAATDLRHHERCGPGHASILFLVDASGSMATRRRLEIAKGAALALLDSSYRRRDAVALMVFRGDGTDLVLPFTDHTANIGRALDDVPSGGRTPLARALIDAAQLLQKRALALLVVFTDGRANVSIGQADPWEEALAACGPLREACAGALVVDCESGPIVLGRARQLSVALNAECVSLNALEATDLTVRIQRRIEAL